MSEIRQLKIDIDHLSKLTNPMVIAEYMYKVNLGLYYLKNFPSFDYFKIDFSTKLTNIIKKLNISDSDYTYTYNGAKSEDNPFVKIYNRFKAERLLRYELEDFTIVEKKKYGSEEVFDYTSKSGDDYLQRFSFSLLAKYLKISNTLELITHDAFVQTGGLQNDKIYRFNIIVTKMPLGNGPYPLIRRTFPDRQKKSVIPLFLFDSLPKINYFKNEFFERLSTIIRISTGNFTDLKFIVNDLLFKEIFNKFEESKLFNYKLQNFTNFIFKQGDDYELNIFDTEIEKSDMLRLSYKFSISSRYTSANTTFTINNFNDFKYHEGINKSVSPMRVEGHEFKDMEVYIFNIIVTNIYPFNKYDD